MPGEESPDSAPRATSGPRHAAPRVSLLTRLNRPVGRAVAVAAVPTAVLMGVGLAPQLAVAEGQPDNPFQDGPCVSATERREQQDKSEVARRESAAAAARRADEAARREATDAAERKTAEAARRKAAEEARRKADAEPRDQPSPEPSPSTSPSEGTSGGEKTPEPSPSESDSGGGGLLGDIGDAAEGLLGSGGQAKHSATVPQESAEPRARNTATPSPSSSSSDDPADPGVTGPLDAVRERTESTVKGDAGPVESATGGTGEGGKKPFPCVERKKVTGETERTSVVLPRQPFSLEASSVTLRGLKYHGVVNVATVDGRRKQVLKFTTESVDIGDLHQLVDGPDGSTYHVMAGKGTTSQIRGGTVTMYTERLEGNLFGVLPVVFDPEHPPPLDLPFARFTDVKIRQAGQLGGDLTVPRLQQHISR